MHDNHVQYVLRFDNIIKKIASIKVCDLYANMVQGRQFLIFHTGIIILANRYTLANTFWGQSAEIIFSMKISTRKKGLTNALTTDEFAW